MKQLNKKILKSLNISTQKKRALQKAQLLKVAALQKRWPRKNKNLT
jgi:hypothetical protein